MMQMNGPRRPRCQISGPITNPTAMDQYRVLQNFKVPMLPLISGKKQPTQTRFSQLLNIALITVATECHLFFGDDPNQKGLTFYQPQTLVTGTSPRYWLATSKSRSPRFALARAFLAFFLPVQVASSRGLQVWMGQKPFNRFSVGVCWQ
jgi:hypothetical protein